MILYEVTNGYIGSSYVRVYVWAKDEFEALMLATKSFKNNTIIKDKEYWKQLKIKPLFTIESKSFVTKPSDDGWDME